MLPSQTSSSSLVFRFSQFQDFCCCFCRRPSVELENLWCEDGTKAIIQTRGCPFHAALVLPPVRSLSSENKKTKYPSLPLQVRGNNEPETEVSIAGSPGFMKTHHHSRNYIITLSHHSHYTEKTKIS